MDVKLMMMMKEMPQMFSFEDETDVKLIIITQVFSFLIFFNYQF